MAAVLALLVLAALATPTLGGDHAPPGHAPAGPAPSLEPADGRRGARAFRIPAPYRPLVHMRPHTETEPDPGTAQQAQEAERRTGGGSDRTTPTTAQLLASSGCRQGERCDTTPQRTQELIEKFLKELAASTHDRTSAEAVRDHDNKVDQGDQRLRPDTTQEPTNRLASLYLDNEQAADKSTSESSQSSDSSEAEPGSGEGDREGSGDPDWSVLESKSHRHPYDDRDGWVTLEPVPWAAAKVSKWRPNPGRRPPWVTLHHGYGDHESSAPHDRWDRPQAASPWHRPALEYPPPARPSLAADPFDYPGHHYGDIITDERPLHHAPWSGEVGGAGGGPAHGPPQPPAYGPTQPPHHHHRPSYSFPPEPLGLDTLHHHHHHQQHHPASYPGEADGEWVLLSSTKGYSLPKHRRLHQRAVSFSARPLTAR